MSYRRWIAGVILCSLTAAAGGAAMLPRPTVGRSSVAVALPDDVEADAALPWCRDRHALHIGIASWYGGPVFQQTANGERFRPDALAAASRSLPFNTRVRVTNLRNGRSVVVRINDRGPYVPGRVIDLTPEAAARLDMKRKGLAPVYIQIVRNDLPTAVR